MKDRVKVKSDQANKRALLQNDDSSIAPDQEDDADDGVGFLQLEKSPRHKVGSLLKRAQEKHAEKAQLEKAETEQVTEKKQAMSGTRMDRALDMLREKSLKLKSPVLSSLAMKVAADPFVKVKKLIQELIEKLVTEAADEASQKGFCDTELGKAKSDRDNAYTKSAKLNAKAESLEAARDLLQDEIAQLTTELAELNSAHETTTELRNNEKEENLDTLTKAQEGLDAVVEAIGILDKFYKGAAKAKVLLQVSPVDEANADRATGANQGNQGAAGGILGMMAVIKSDFERTIKVTKEAEYNASREYAEFDTTTKSSISSKETSKEMKEYDLKNTVAQLDQAMADLTEQQTLLDDSLKQLESLKPACIDTGMSYADRVAKREEEIEALKNAMCILDTDKVEADC
jgi:chromosome segregation ATPase